jgi:hypothetical protein
MPVHLVALQRKYPRTCRTMTVTFVANAESPAQTRFDSEDYTGKRINAPPYRRAEGRFRQRPSAVHAQHRRRFQRQFADAENSN